MFLTLPEPNLGRRQQIFQIWIRPVTPENGHFALKTAPYELLDEFKERSQLGRELRTSDVADVAYLMCLPEAEAIRGQTIVVDGGYSVVG